ncbi:MAG: hypothetical protein RMM53_11855, partial [Bacteroidia bacterium]|nr:hypothetical protein [Bacteroidia bacterium]
MRLPLSWRYAPEIAEPRFVWARRNWPAFADVPGDFLSVYPLLPRRCFLRGLDRETFEFLCADDWKGVQTGVEIVLDLPYEPSQSVQRMMRRAMRSIEPVVCRARDYDASFINCSRYARTPKIRYMFRNLPEDEWLGARTVRGWAAGL